MSRVRSVALKSGHLLAATALVTLAPAAAAQQSTPTARPTPRPTSPPIVTLPGVERFTLPPSGQQPRPVVTPTPRAVVTPPPVPAPTATPRPRATVAATPTPRTTPTPTPAAAAPTPTPTPIATAAAVPLATPTPEATLPAAPTATPTPVSAPPAAAPVWPWIALGSGGTLAVVLAGWALLARRRRREAWDEEAELVEPVAAPPPPPAMPRPAAQAAPPPPPAPAEPVVFDFKPRTLAISDREIALDFEAMIGNPTDVAMDGVRLAMAMVSASPQQDELSGAFHAAGGLEPLLPQFDLPAREGRTFTARLMMARENVHVVTVGGKTMFVPLVLIDVRWRGGLSLKRHGADFMVGTAPQPGGKLGPIWFDRWQHSGLAATRYFPRPLAQVAAERQPA